MEHAQFVELLLQNTIWQACKGRLELRRGEHVAYTILGPSVSGRYFLTVEFTCVTFDLFEERAWLEEFAKELKLEFPDLEFDTVLGHRALDEFCLRRQLLSR